MNRWSSTRARVLYGVLPVLVGIGLAVGVATDPEAVQAFALLGVAVALAGAWRASRLQLRLDQDQVVVVNPLWTHRIPFDEVTGVYEGWIDLVSQSERHLVGAPVLTIGRPFKIDLKAYATWLLPATERTAAREMIVQTIRTLRPAAAPDSVLGILVAADPDGQGELSEAWYADDAAEIEETLREQPLSWDYLTELFDEPPPDLLDRLNALR